VRRDEKVEDSKVKCEERENSWRVRRKVSVERNNMRVKKKWIKWKQLESQEDVIRVESKGN
jgi:hypothetical protein